MHMPMDEYWMHRNMPKLTEQKREERAEHLRLALSYKEDIRNNFSTLYKRWLKFTKSEEVRKLPGAEDMNEIIEVLSCSIGMQEIHEGQAEGKWDD